MATAAFTFEDWKNHAKA